MATFEIIEATPIYYVIDVCFLGLVFRQMIASIKTGVSLDSQLQKYADDYEKDWIALGIVT